MSMIKNDEIQAQAENEIWLSRSNICDKAALTKFPRKKKNVARRQIWANDSQNQTANALV